MEKSTFKTHHIVFCPKCKKRTNFKVYFFYQKYTCSECGLTIQRDEYPEILKDLERYQIAKIEENIKQVTRIKDGNGILNLLGKEEIQPKILMEQVLTIIKKEDFSEKNISQLFNSIQVNLKKRSDWGENFDINRKKEILFFFKEDLKNLLDISAETPLSNLVESLHNDFKEIFFKK